MSVTPFLKKNPAGSRFGAPNGHQGPALYQLPTALEPFEGVSLVTALGNCAFGWQDPCKATAYCFGYMVDLLGLWTTPLQNSNFPPRCGGPISSQDQLSMPPGLSGLGDRWEALGERWIER